MKPNLCPAEAEPALAPQLQMISEEVGTSVISRSLQGVTLVAVQDSHFLCKRNAAAEGDPVSV